MLVFFFNAGGYGTEKFLVLVLRKGRVRRSHGWRGRRVGEGVIIFNGYALVAADDGSSGDGVIRK